MLTHPTPLYLAWTGKKIRVKCNEDDTIGDLKKLVAAQTGGYICMLIRCR